MNLLIEPIQADRVQAHDVLAWLASRVGSADFYELLVDTLSQFGGYDCGEVMIFHRTRQPRPLASRLKMSGRRVGPEAYFDNYYREDPVYRAFLGGAPSGCYLLSGAIPDFTKSSFFTEYYSRTRISHEINLLFPMRASEDTDTAVLVWLGRHDQSELNGAPDHGALAGIEPVVRSLVARHVEIVGLGADACHVRALVSQRIEQAFVSFGTSLISSREQEVLAYCLKGYSAALTADRLGISEGTVKNHRKSIHRKLDIGSQAELFALFIQAIPYAASDLTADPLAKCQSMGQPPLLGH